MIMVGCPWCVGVVCGVVCVGFVWWGEGGVGVCGVCGV